MARSNTTREPKKGGFAPGFSAGDEPPARNTSAYFNLSKGGRPDISRPNADSRPVPPPPPPPPPFNERSTPKRPDPLKAYRTQCGPEDPFGNKDRISTPYATSGGEKTYFTSAGLGRGGTSRDSLTSEDVYDSEPLERNNSHTKHASQTSQRGHRSASPKLRSPRPVSVSSTSSSSSDESLREGVEQLYTSTDRSHSAHGRNQNRHLRPAYQPFLKVDVAEGGNGLPPGSRSDTTPKQRPHTTGSNIDPSMTEGFMEHRMKHEAERTQVSGDPVRSPPRTNDPTQSQQRPLHRPKSWHEKYGPANESDAKDYIGRPATGEVPAKPSMYDDSGCDPTFFSPCSKEWCKQWPFGGSRLSATSARPRVPPPYWAIPSCISPSRRKETARDHRDLDSNFQALRTEPVAEDADNVVLNSFTIPNETNGQPAHPPPLRSHSSDTIDVNFSPSDWHGKFTGKPEEHFEPPPRHTNVSRGRASPTKRPFSPLKQAYPAPSTERSPIPNGDSHVPPVPPQPSHQETYSADKWAPYFKPGTLNWPPPPPPTGNAVQGASRKRPITPSRRGSRNVFKRPAVPKPASVAPAVDDAGDDSASSNVGSVSGQSSGNSSAMDLDTSTTPPGGKAAESEQHANSVTPRPPVPPRPTGPSHPHIQDDDQLSLGNLKNVAPFAPNQDGIIDLNDLATALPFDSKPSTKLPRTSSPIPPQQLSLPNPPKAPPVPDKLTQSSWNSYIAAMRAYMFEWNAYNTKMLNHFNERQTSAIEMMKKPEWIGAVGEGTGNWGYKKYMRGVEEDFRVREHWDVSWERHRECMARLGEVRDRVLGREGAV